jgi:hypothetical protein
LVIQKVCGFVGVVFILELLDEEDVGHRVDVLNFTWGSSVFFDLLNEELWVDVFSVLTLD